MADQFRVENDCLTDAALVGFSGREAISDCFAIDVFVTLPDVSILNEALGSQLTLLFEVEPTYKLVGVVDTVEILHEMTEKSLARLRVVPRLSLLRLSNHSRMFTGEKIPDIIETVLKEAGLSSGTDYELRLTGSYEAEEHVCQYQESDLRFISRWMDHEGIFYFFEYEDGVDKLVIADDKGVHSALSDEAIRYHPAANQDDWGGRAFQRFSTRRKARPKKVRLFDYDYGNPSLAVDGDADADDKGYGEVVLFGGDRFFSAGRGKALASRRAEALLASQSVSKGQTTSMHLRSGFTFQLGHHPIDAFNDSYLCVEVVHHANLRARAHVAKMCGLDENTTYRAEIVATLASAVFRPARLIPAPRVEGYVTGFVDGPADSDYAQLDDHGRYNIILHFDESGLDAGTATTKLRMMQPHAGNPEGMHFPLRKGTEVMVSFLDGDPDRPLIAGAVPNTPNPSVVTSDNHTHNVVHTGGDNHFDFEDQKDSQWIWFFSPTKKSYMHLGKPFEDRTHHIVLHTDGNNLFDYGTNQDIKVGGVLDENVKGPVTETYDATQTSEITGVQKTTVDDATEEVYEATQSTITVGAVTEDYQVPHHTIVNDAPRSEVFLASQTTDVTGGGLVQQITDSHMRMVAGDTKHTLSATHSRHVTGAVNQMVGGNVLRVWGPNTTNFKSLNLLVPGGVTDIHVGYTLLVPNDTWTWPTTTWVASFKNTVRMLTYGIMGPKAEACGLNVGFTSIKRELTGISRAINGVIIEVQVGEGEGEAVYNGHHAFSIVP